MPELLPNGTGSRRPGPTPDARRAAHRALFPEWSDRTFARYWKAHCRLAALRAAGAINEYQWSEIIAAATRQNGTLNVAELDRRTEDMAAMWIATNTPEDL